MQINNNIYSQSFKRTYTGDTGTATSKSQIFTLGAMMNNFWINNANMAFNRIRNTGVYGKVDINVKDYKDRAFEAVLKNNRISYEKKNSGINYMA